MHHQPPSRVAPLTLDPSLPNAEPALPEGAALGREPGISDPGDRPVIATPDEASTSTADFLPPLEPAPPDDHWLGRLIDDRYRLEALLGEGTTGRVYRARQERTGREVAVKLLHEHLSRDETSVRRFQREARVACRINHKNAITVHDCGFTSEGRCYLVTELIEGETLREVLDRDGLLEPQRALLLFQEILAGVAAAHDKGVVHRELNPGNIFVCHAGTADEHVKVFDFGGARLMEGDGDSDVTGTGHLNLGHLLDHIRYLPPERLRRDLSPNPRGDVYALGLILFELCTGSHPYDVSDPLVMMAMHLNEPAPLLREVCPGRWFSPALQGLVGQLLAKDPEQRPADACEVAKRLQHVEEMGALMGSVDAASDDVELELEMVALPADEDQAAPRRPPAPTGGAQPAAAGAAGAANARTQPLRLIAGSGALSGARGGALAAIEPITLPAIPRALALANGAGGEAVGPITVPAIPRALARGLADSARLDSTHLTPTEPPAPAAADVTADAAPASSATAPAAAASAAPDLPTLSADDGAAVRPATGKPSWAATAAPAPIAEEPLLIETGTADDESDDASSDALAALALPPPPTAARRLGQFVIALCYLLGSAALVFCLGVAGFRWLQEHQRPAVPSEPR